MRNIVLIGAGTMGRIHAGAYEKIPGVHVAGIVETDREAAEIIGKPLGARWFATYEDAVRELDSVDVVDICVPTFFHKEFALKAAADGKHVICEKPLAGNLEDARAIIEACKEHGVRLFVGHVVRFFPEYQRAKALLDDGAIGKPAIVRTSRTGAFPRGWQGWYADTSKSGGTILDLVIHDFDFLRWCFGDVERVYAKGLDAHTSGGLDYTLTTIRFQSGLIAHVEGSWSHDAFSMRLEIAGKTGIIDYDSAKTKPLIFFPRNSQQEGSPVAVPESPLHRSPYYRELRHFMDCLDHGSEPIVTSEDAYQAVQISLMAIQSMQTGKPVEKSGFEAGRAGVKL